MGKSIFKSKTFWANVIAGSANLAGIIPIPYFTEGLAVANIILRMVTKEPVHVL